MTRPAVTVLIDTFNHERFLRDAIVSVLEQDFSAAETEILVVDDGSTDGTPAIAREFAPRVRYLRKENGGQASAFNFGIPQAQGEVVAFLDGDDWWKKNKLTAVMNAFAAHPQAGVVGHGIVQTDSERGESSELTPEHPGLFDLRTPQGAQTFRNYMCFLGTSRVAIRRSILQHVLPIPEALVMEADEFMSGLAVAYGGAVLLADPLTHYRIHGDNLYQFRTNDAARMRRKMNVIACLAREWPARLAAAGVGPEEIEIIVAPAQSMATRMRLTLDGGWPWETYRAERADLQLAYRRMGLGYRLYKEAVLTATLLMPPRWFYRLRDWYSAKNLRRFRRVVGEPEPMAAVIERPIAERGAR
jgi:glycosyltransferase involved in cell wall biosynthesis